MYKIAIYVEGGTRWEFNTSDGQFLEDISKNINDLKNKNPLIEINLKPIEKRFFIRRDKVNLMTIEKVSHD